LIEGTWQYFIHNLDIITKVDTKVTPSPNLKILIMIKREKKKRNVTMDYMNKIMFIEFEE
jgi:hypothetical protein